jgi:hypothetical protein
VEPYAGFEPHVGEIRALRTFRIGAGGVLYPLFSDTPWDDGTNKARCRLIQAGVRAPHAAPESTCTCGFYAYGSEEAAGEYPHAQYVLAVIACWGGVIAGTRGVRAEFGRVEAIWLSDEVPAELAGAVDRRYPAVAVYHDRPAMLAEHPPTELDCYEPTVPRRGAGGRWLRGAIACAIGISAFPADWWAGGVDPRLASVAALGALVITALVMGRGGRTDLAARRRRLVLYAVALWVAAPFTGPVGTWALRIPLLQLALLIWLQRHQLRRAAGRFPAPIEHA